MRDLVDLLDDTPVAAAPLVVAPTATALAFLGVDPGMSGGYGLIAANGDVLAKGAMEALGKVFDIHAWVDVLRELRATYRIDRIEAFLEAASARPGQGVSTMFKFGRVYGLTEGGLAAAGIPYELVQPARWTRTMLVGVEGADSDRAKSRNVAAAKRLFPGVDLRKNTACKTAHEGVVDALLIAEYGRRCRTGAASKPLKRRRA